MAVPTAARAKVTAAMGLKSHRDRDSLGPEADIPMPLGSSGIFGDAVMILIILGKIKRCHNEMRGCTRVRIPQAHPSTGVWKWTLRDHYKWRVGWPLLQRATGPLSIPH